MIEVKAGVKEPYAGMLFPFEAVRLLPQSIYDARGPLMTLDTEVDTTERYTVIAYSINSYRLLF